MEPDSTHTTAFPRYWEARTAVINRRELLNRLDELMAVKAFKWRGKTIYKVTTAAGVCFIPASVSQEALDKMAKKLKRKLAASKRRLTESSEKAPPKLPKRS
jgi:hypothetical protein